MFTNVNRPSAVDVLRPFTIGDQFYADTTTTLAKRAIGSTNDVYTVSGGVPVWSSSITLTSLTVTDSGFFIVGNVDATKRITFQVDSQTANDTLTIDTGAQTDSRTLTVPVLTGNATLAVLSESQTFSGAKTFSAVTTVSNATASTSSANGALVVTGGAGIGGALNVASDTDVTTVLGRIALGSPAADTAFFSHFDNLSGTNYALAQDAAGATSINAKTGQTITFRVNNTTGMTFASTGATVVVPWNITNSTASTSTTTGALIVTGGAGIGGQVTALRLSATDSITASGATSTAIITAGGDAIAADKTFDFNTAAGNNRLFRWLSGGVARWGIGANSSAESGSDAGSRLIVRAFSDAGSSLGDIITMFRASGGSILVTRPISNSSSIVSTSATSGVGYATGAGGTVTQGSGSGKATGVTLNTVCGTITMDGANLNADTTVAFTFTNSAIANTDLVVIQHSSVGTLGGYNFAVTPGSGSATVSVRNVTPGNLAEAIVLRFAIIKAVTS